MKKNVLRSIFNPQRTRTDGDHDRNGLRNEKNSFNFHGQSTVTID